MAFWKRITKAAGPGFITGAADDDPSGIATYSQTGAIFGLAQLWIVPFTYPFMVAIQELAGRIGLVTGSGIAGVLRKHYPRWILACAVGLLLCANIINIGADLNAMASSLQLVLPFSFPALLAASTIAILALQLLVPYPLYAKFLKYLTLSLFAYVIVAFLVVTDWGPVFRALVTPHVEWSQEYLMNIAAFLGTTISPYLFFWQADEEVEEEIERHEIDTIGSGTPRYTEEDVSDMRLDTGMGMLFSQLITFFIITSVASTLGLAGITHIETAAQAASALQPVAGNLAFLLFAIGIVGTGMLAIPVLAGSISYCISESFGWREGLSLKPEGAPGFYAVMIAVTIAGVIVSLLPVGSITMLYWAAIMNGLLAPPIMFILYRIGTNEGIMGRHVSGGLSRTLVLIATAAMGVVSVALIWSLFFA